MKTTHSTNTIDMVKNSFNDSQQAAAEFEAKTKQADKIAEPVSTEFSEPVSESENENPVPSSLQTRIEELEAELQKAREADLRSKADYHNIVRRTQEERSKLIKLASLGFVEGLLQPLDHLRLATEHIEDQGLQMVVTQLWQVLEENGLKVLEVMGKKFDPELMEVVEKAGDRDMVTKIVSQGYTLNGEVIRPAQVVVG